MNELILTPELVSQGFSLRQAGPGDFPDYCIVKRVCYEKYADEFLGGWTDEIQRQMTTDRFSEALGETFFQAVLLNGETVGFLTYDIQDDKIDGFSVQLLPAARNKEMGSFFVKHVTSVSEETGKPIFIKVFRSNPARNLYERFGFTVYEVTAVDHLMRYDPGK